MRDGDADRPVRRARVVTLVAVAPAPLTTAIMPGIALTWEAPILRAILGGIGIAIVVITQSIVLYRSLRHETGAGPPPFRANLPDLSYGLAVIASIPLVAPLAADQWATWAWLGGSVAGSLPLRYRHPAVLATGWVALLVVVLVVGIQYEDPLGYGLTALSVGISVAAVCGLPIALWRLFGDLRTGRDAQARLAVAEERLRFARDIHDLVGHTLSIIALKAELVERLHRADPDRAAAEAGQLRGLTSEALVQLRSTVDGYREIDLDQQLTSVRDALDAAGIAYRIDIADRPDSTAIGHLLGLAVREATTNVLRHAGTGDCTITLEQTADSYRLRVINDLPAQAGPASTRVGTGLTGMRERFAAAGGNLRAGPDGDRFVFEAQVPIAVPQEDS